ncbi:hypothetical protein DEI92_05205 [Curtobacterium sp. MCBD17_034]|uniref:ComEA family DNA-binding protein n=1 Tax=unclassified Curtobacterium TaxID=257496 RepID=UPI000DA70476|nr:MULTISPECIES: ComEA family DNA-binding protein [unclassified Curtobacterium]PZF61017.1 hypothetical protein DEI92_05205 [Curtobacterium sp. MCBD17_034]PZM40367.1 hypothetical protein DEI90_01440 [Curtobacterium sp. MCBD17_031]
MTGDEFDDTAPVRTWIRPRALVVVAIAVTVVALVLLAVGALTDHATTVQRSADAVSVSAPATASTGVVPPAATPATVVVHVLGAVATPGLVELPVGARVDDAVTEAGGAADHADLSRVNLARPLVDGEQLYVPRDGEDDVPEAPGPVVGGGSASVGRGEGPTLVDLNTADATALETLPGIGPALADRIVAWRTEHGRFSSVEDLLDVSGIGDATFADLRDRVRV